MSAINFPTISERALLNRVNRKLQRRDGLRVRVCRETSRWLSTLGRYYVVNISNNVFDCDVDLEALARDLGVIQKNETLSA